MARFTSTTSTLLGNAVFTGGTCERDRYDTVAGTVKASHDGSLAVQQSPDGTNWDYVSTTSVTGGTGAAFSVTLYAPYWRIVYTNGGTNQTSFRLQASAQASGDS